MGTALYRKYRPTTLSSVVGQDQVVKPLENAIKSGKFSHAYLFTGPRGCGKTSVARIFAHEVNDFPYEIEDSYTDIIEIDAASNTGVDNIRELREKANVAPSKGKYKVYIIDEVHMLSKAAFNALLKTLEEPPRHVIFIMATTDAYKVPITISSRSQVFHFELAEPKVMSKHLKEIAKKEKISITDDAIDLIVERGGGSFRDSISLLDQISTLKSGEIEKNDILEALGLPESAKISEILDAYKQGKIAEISEKVQDLLNNNTKPELVAEQMLKMIITRPEPETIKLLDKLPAVSAPFPEAKLLFALLSDFSAAPQSIAISKSVTPQTVATAQTAQTALAPKVPPKTTVPPQIAAEPENSTSSTAFDKSTYLEKIGELSTMVKNTLEKCEFSLSGHEISIIPSKNFERTILTAKNNQKILEKFLPDGFSLVVLSPGENIKKDPVIDRISGIIGEGIQEVKEDGVPF